jgi:hypothetical protein
MVTLLQAKVSGSPGSRICNGMFVHSKLCFHVHAGAHYDFFSSSEKEFQSLVNKKYRDRNVTFVKLVQEWKDYSWEFDAYEMVKPGERADHYLAKVGEGGGPRHAAAAEPPTPIPTKRQISSPLLCSLQSSIS